MGAWRHADVLGNKDSQSRYFTTSSHDLPNRKINDQCCFRSIGCSILWIFSNSTTKMHELLSVFMFTGIKEQQQSSFEGR